MLIAKSRNSAVCAPFSTCEPRMSFAYQNCVAAVSKLMKSALTENDENAERIPERPGIVPTRFRALFGIIPKNGSVSVRYFGW